MKTKSQDGVTSSWFEDNLMQILILSKVNYLLTYCRVSPTRFETNFVPIHIGDIEVTSEEYLGIVWDFGNCRFQFAYKTFYQHQFC